MVSRKHDISFPTEWTAREPTVYPIYLYIFVSIQYLELKNASNCLLLKAKQCASTYMRYITYNP